MPSLLTRFTAAFRLELRLLCRHWSFAALHLLWAGFLIYNYHDRDLITARAALDGAVGKLATGLIALGALFLAAAGASRAQRVRVADLETTFPSGVEIILGRLLAGLAGAMTLLTAPLALALHEGPLASFLAGLPTFLAESLITFATATAAAWCVVTWLGHRRWVYPLLAGGWFGVFAGPRVLRNVMKIDLPQAALLDFTRMDTTHYTELWGRLADGTLPLWLDLFYLGLALGITALAACRVQAQRLRRPPVIPGLALLLALLLTVTSGGVFVSTQHARLARAIDPSQHRPQDPYGRTGGSAHPPEAIDRYDLAVDLSDPATLRYRAELTLRNQAATPISNFSLTLDRALRITDASLPFERRGDTLALALPEPLEPGQTRSVTLAYSGSIAVLYAPYTETPQFMFFTKDAGVRLSTSAGWYPLPAEVDLAANRFELRHPPAAFRLTVDGPDEFGIISNLPRVAPGVFQAERATWSALVASPQLAVEVVDGVTIAAPRHVLADLRALVPLYKEALTAFTPFFPGLETNGQLLTALDDNAGFPDKSPPADTYPIVMLNPAWPLAPGNLVLRQNLSVSLGYDLWTIAGGDPRAQSLAVSAAIYFLWAYHVTGGDPASIEENLGLGLDSTRDPETAALVEVYRVEGKAAIIRVLDRMRAEEASLRRMGREELAAWIREAAND